MANLKQSIKRVKVANAKTEFNKAQRSKLRTSLKKAFVAIEEEDENAQELVNTAVKILDKSATKGAISKAKAARHKSQLARALNTSK